MPEFRNSSEILYDCIVLENNKFKVLLGKDRPVIYEYSIKTSVGTLFGDFEGAAPVFTICKELDTLMQAHFKVHYEVNPGNGSADYAVSVVSNNNVAVSLEFVFELTERGISIEFRNVREYENYHLMNIQMPQLITVKACGSIAKMAIPSDCGRLLDVATASCRDYKYGIDWINPMLTGMVYNDGVIGILESDSFENLIVSSIYQIDEIKYGSLSMNFIYRLAEFDLADYGHKIPAINPEYHLKVQDSAKAEISLITDYDGDGDISWIDAAKFIKDKTNVSINPYYANKLISKIALDMPDNENRITFDEVMEYVKTVAFVTNRQPHVLYLVGWQYNGHDTGYPAVDKANERLGGYEGLVKLIKVAKENNAIISFHDNYDDAYMSSPHWDKDIISKDSQGNLMKSGNFGAGQAYLLSNYEYAHKYGLKRVQNTLRQYPVTETYHIDVLAGGFKGGRRYDFNPENPSSAKKNLIGKLMIIDEFKKHGLDVTTEDFSSLFVGHVSHFWHLNFFDSVFFRNEEIIPLVPFIYHSKASYGYRCNSKRDVIYSLLHGAAYSCDINKAEFFKQIGYYCLVALPWLKLYGKAMKDYTQYGTKEKVIYEDGSYVEVDFEKIEYTVAVMGEIIARNFTTFVSSPDGTYLGFSLDGGEFCYKIPEEKIDNRNIQVYKLNMNCTEENAEVCISDDYFKFTARRGSVYKIVFK